MDWLEHILSDDEGGITEALECTGCYSERRIGLCGCGGVIHNEFLDEGYDSIYLRFACDNCGYTGATD